MSTGLTREGSAVGLLVVAMGIAGCAYDPREDNASFGGDGGAQTDGVSGDGIGEADGADASDDDDDDGTADGNDDDANANDGDDDGDDDGIKLDVGSPDAGDGLGGCSEGEACTCTAVDVLFVIDNSGSMCFYQDQLAAAFPGFVDAMFDALPSGTDLHVGLTTSGFELGGSHSETNCVAAEPQPIIDEFYVRPGEGAVSGNGLQGRLLEWNGERYFAADTANDGDRQALSSWFSGAATSVGCGVSSFEFNASGAAWALHPDNAATNDGFLRDEDTVLVVFILSDEADQSLEVEGLEFLHDTVVDAKAGCGGDACVVTGGLLSPWCSGAMNASEQFLQSFGGGATIGSIGSPFEMPDYGTVVGETFAQVVAQACDDIVPEG